MYNTIAIYLKRASQYLRSSASSRYGSVSTAEDDGYFDHQSEEEIFVSQRLSLTPSNRLTPSHSRMSPMPCHQFIANDFISQPLSRNNSKTNRLQKKIKTCSLLSVETGDRL